MVSHLISSLTKSLRGSGRSDHDGLAWIPPSPIQNRARAADFYDTCAAAVQEHRARPLNAPPADGRGHGKNDPRIVAYHAMRRMMQASHADTVRDIPDADLQPLALYAEAVGSDKVGFGRLLRRLDPSLQVAAIDARVTWIEAARASASAPAPMPDVDRPGESQDSPPITPDAALFMAAPPAATGMSDMSLAIPPGGMLTWVKGQTPAMWHEMAAHLDWTSSRVDPTTTAAVHWIALQDTCDRATALAFLARAVADGIEQQTHGHLDLNDSRLMMTALHRNLSYGFYKVANLAPPKHLGAEIFRLFRLGASDGPESRYALDPHTVGGVGDAPNAPPYQFRDGRPVVTDLPC